MKKIPVTLGLITVLSFFILLFASCKKKESTSQVTTPNTSQFFTWSLNGVNGQMTSPKDSLAAIYGGNNILLSGYSTTTIGNQVSMAANGPAAPGTYTVGSLDFVINNKSYDLTSTPLTMTITKFGDVDGYVEGSYNGTVKDASNVTYTYTGQFRLKRR
jgi:hypothetical protein